MFYGLSHNESYYEDKISLFIALGPVARVTNEKSSLIHFMSSNFTRNTILDVTSLLGIYELFPSNWMTTDVMDFLCDKIPMVCEFSIYLVADEKIDEDDEMRSEVYLGHFPSGTSVRTLDHFGQIRAEGEFRKYDYGKKINIQKYGTDIPPIIDLNNIKNVPIAMLVGTKDELADNIDNKWAKN